MTADHSKTQLQTSLPTPPSDVPSAPAVVPPVKSVRARLSPEAFNKITDRLEAVLVALVLLFAFLTASFAIRNSDFFQHLATGRLIAQGQYEVGKDPFSFATQGVRWVNHSWLYSYLLYRIYSFGASGVVVLIVLKALAITVLAGILLVLSRKPGQRWLIPVACTAVAVLALSVRLYLQPIVVSYLFLGLTLLVLRWPHLWPVSPTAAARSYRCFWLLVPLFALWVNCDQWFFLGPLAAGLYWLGEYVQDALATDRLTTRPAGELRTLGYAVLVGALACLLNPQHVFALTLPPQLGLSAAATAAGKDPSLESLFASPLDNHYWTIYQGYSASGLAYIPLLIGGIVSFMLSYQTFRYWRVLLFVAFGVLSLYHARAIPFFAIVAGPIAALNFLDCVVAVSDGEVEPDRLRERWLAGRLVALLGAVALVVCAIPGWTQPQPYAARHLEWKVVPDESLVRACTRMAEWRRDGKVDPNAHWFNLSVDVANYMAWYCPGALDFLDLRLGLYDATAADYFDARAELLKVNQPPGSQGQPPPAPEAWPKVFQKQGVDYVVFSSADTLLVGQELQRIFNTPAWTLLSMDGRTLVFAWSKDAATHARNEALRYDPNGAAFGAQAQQAPRERPERPAVKREWYLALWEVPPARQEEVDDAAIYHLYYTFNLEQLQHYLDRRRQILVNGAALVSVVGGRPAWVTLTDPRLPVFQLFVRPPQPVSPAPLYLGLRGLRRSLQVNPDDAQAYLWLAQLYTTLFWRAQEIEVVQRGNFQQLAQIRQAQIAWALNQALTLNPDLEEAHLLLVQWYKECRERNPLVPNYLDGNFGRPFLDTELRHYKEALRLEKGKLEALKSSGNPGSGGVSLEERVKQGDARVQQMEQDIQKLDADVKHNLDQFVIKSANKLGVQRAYVALDLGLGDKALEVLRETDDKDMVVTQGQQQLPVGFIMKVKLLIALGEVNEARTYVHPDNKSLFQFGLPEFHVPAYDWFRLLIASASGDYDDADDALAALAQFEIQNDAFRFGWLQRFSVVGLSHSQSAVPAARAVVALALGQTLLNLAPQAAGMPWQVFRQYQSAPQLAGAHLAELTAAVLSTESDYPALRGWLALEAGDIAAAHQYDRAALLPALPHDRNLALFAAVGLMVPAEQARLRAGPLWLRNDLLPLRAVLLAKLGLYYLENAAAPKH